MLIGVAVIAVVLVVAAVSLGGGGSKKKASSAQTAGLFNGIAQSGGSLGDPNAPVTLSEFADLQCPYCGEYALQVLPSIVQKYVRTGKVRLVFHPVAILGSDSVLAARVAFGAGNQNHMWEFIDRFYASQGREGSGYVTPDFLRKIGGEVPGLNVERALQAGQADATLAQLSSAHTLAKSFKIDSTPSFVIGPTGERGHRFQVGSFAPQAFGTVIDAELAK